jgi:tetratricopeptide (TPR) repeat protein
MKCVRPNDGSLITQYILNLLDEADRCRFEEHLMSCEPCRLNLLEANPELTAFGTHKKELVETLHQEGITFERLKEELSAVKKKTGILRELLDDVTQSIGWLVHGKRLIPVAGVLVVALLLVFWTTTRQPSNPYLPLLSFEKYPYQESRTRAGLPTPSTSPLFSEGLQAYNEGDYKKAAEILTEATKESPNEWSAWYFLGVSYYLDGQARPAITALLVADSLNKYAMEIEVKWYLAQAYLLDNDPDSALPILQWLEEKPSDYSSRATDLIKQIQEVDAK